MIDLHTHILPDWDDGAKDWDESFRMCHIARKDGIEKVVLTPHIYRMSKHGDDLRVLEARMAEMWERAARIPVALYRGAEVFVHHNMVEDIKKNRFAVNDSNYVFIEFPADHVPHGSRELIFRMMLEGFIPIISHPERNALLGERPGVLYELVNMGCLGQVTSKSVSGEFGPETKKRAVVFLKHNLVHFIASDAHDWERRPPELSRAVEAARKIVGEEKALAMVTEIPQAILDNKPVPDYGEPVNPVRKAWAVRLPRFLRKREEREESEKV